MTTPHFSRHFWTDQSILETQLPTYEFGQRSFPRLDAIDMSELFEHCSTDSPAGQVSLSDDLTVFMPQNYEPKYAYPLIIWLSGSEQHGRELLEFMPRISSRNYFAVFVNDVESSTLEDGLFETVYQIRREYHIHSERILLAAFGNGAHDGLNLLLRRPEWFAGLISLGGCFTNTPLRLVNFDDLHGKRVLLGMHSGNPKGSIPETIRIAQLLHTAGMDVATRSYDGDNRVTSRMLSDVNHWMMDGICESNLV